MPTQSAKVISHPDDADYLLTMWMLVRAGVPAVILQLAFAIMASPLKCNDAIDFVEYFAGHMAVTQVPPAAVEAYF